MYQTQLQWEQTYNKSNIRKWVMDEVMAFPVCTDMFTQTVDLIEGYLAGEYYASKQKRVDHLMSIAKSDVAEEIAIQLFCCVLPIRSNGRVCEPIQGIATMLGLQFFDHQLDAVKTGAELLAVCEPAGLYDLILDPRHLEESTNVYPRFQLDDDTVYKIHCTMYMPPMLSSPIPWDGKVGGHLLGSGSPILGTGNDIGQTQNLDALNRLQAIKWTLNETMLQEPELPKAGTENDPRKLKQHNDRCLQSKRVYDMILEQGNEFFFVWKYDKRGRMYSQGYDINLQGSEYKKSILEFATQYTVTGV